MAPIVLEADAQRLLDAVRSLDGLTGQAAQVAIAAALA